MAMELRHIVFRSDEVVAAIKFYWERLALPHPTGSVIKCGPEGSAEGGGVRFRIVLNPPSPDGITQLEPHHTVLESADLAAALILYCREKGIPLPRLSAKSLEIYGTQLCLLATMNPTKDTPLNSEAMVI